MREGVEDFVRIPQRVRVLTTLIEDEILEARLEVIDTNQQTVVTVIELLSPTNKITGSPGRASYEQKRREVMTSTCHFVEIDLLREGDSDAKLDLQEVLATYYERAAYDLLVNYCAEPTPELATETAEWANAPLTSKGMR